jgi:hypothetical protein
MDRSARLQMLRVCGATVLLLLGSTTLLQAQYQPSVPGVEEYRTLNGCQTGQCPWPAQQGYAYTPFQQSFQPTTQYFSQWQAPEGLDLRYQGTTGFPQQYQFPGQTFSFSPRQEFQVLDVNFFGSSQPRPAPQRLRLLCRWTR